MKRILPMAAILALSTAAAAKPSVNDVQQCQAIIDFTIERVGSVEKYDAASVKTITDGLTTYNKFLQAEHVGPGLLAFTNGDAAKAKNFQTQIDAYKAQLVAGLKAKHPQERIFTDQAVAIDNCYTAAPMDGSQKEIMTKTLMTIVA